MSSGAPPSPVDDAATPSSVLTGRKPDISAAQLLGVAGAVIAVAVSFGANISREQQEAILALTAAIAAILFGADAHIRSHRARAEAVRHLADQHAASVSEVLNHHREIVTQTLAANQPAPPLVYPLPPTQPGK